MNRDHLMGYAPITERLAHLQDCQDRGYLSVDDMLAYTPDSTWPLGLPERVHAEFAARRVRACGADEFEVKNYPLPDGSTQPTPQQIEHAMRQMLAIKRRIASLSVKSEEQAHGQQMTLADAIANEYPAHFSGRNAADIGGAALCGRVVDASLP